MLTHQKPEAAPSHIGLHPVYFAGGFGYDQMRNQGVLTYLETQGYETLPALPNIKPVEVDTGFTVSRGDETLAISRKHAAMQLGRIVDETVVANVQQHRAGQLITELERSPKPVDAVLQSADALNGVVAAAERPELFNNIVLAYPGGLVRQPKPLQAAKGIWSAMRTGRQQGMLTPIDESQKFESFDRQRAKRDALSDKATSAAVAASVTLSYQGNLLSKIRSGDNPPGLSLVLGAHDWMIRPELVIENLSPTDVDYILITDTGHGIKGRKDVMDAILDLFPKMEALKATQQNETAAAPLVERLLFLGDIPQDRQSQLLELASVADAHSAIK